MIQVNDKSMGIRPALELRESLREKGIYSSLSGASKTGGYAVLVNDSRIDEARRIFAKLHPAPGVPAR